MPATDRALFLDDHSNRARGMGNNDELAKVAKRKARHVNFISPYTCRGRSYPHSDRSGQEQITMMQPYKGYFITGSALLVCCSIGVDDGAVEKTQALEEFVTESVVGSLQIAEMLGIEAP